MLTQRALGVMIALLLAPSVFADPQSDRFAVAGISEAEVRSIFEALQDGVRSENREKIAALVEYPLSVNGPGTSRLIADRAQLLADFSDIFTSRVRQQVIAQRFDELFVNFRGVMVGSGEVWLSGVCDADSPAGTCKNARVRITTVNPDERR